MEEKIRAGLETGYIGHPVKVQEIIKGQKHAYENAVIEEMKALNK